MPGSWATPVPGSWATLVPGSWGWPCAWELRLNTLEDVASLPDIRSVITCHAVTTCNMRDCVAEADMTVVSVENVCSKD